MYALDYYLRTRDGNLITGELPASLQLTLLSVVGLVSLYYFYIGSAALKIYARIAVIAVQGILAVALLLWLSLMYICRTGIDCL